MSDYTPSGAPATSSSGSSSAIRSELELIRAAIATKADTDGANSFSGLQTLAAGFALTGVVVSGYGTGAGGSVTQTTSKTTAVTLDKPCGLITTHNAIVAADEIVVFRFNNSLISGLDVLSANISNGNGWKYAVRAYNFNAGYCYIAIKNDTAGALAEALPISFIIHRAVAL